MVRAVIAGAGALGTFLSARLHAAGLEVSIIGRGARRDEIARDGIRFLKDGAVHYVQVLLHDSSADFRPADLLFLCCKAPDVPALLEDIEPLCGSGTAIITVQNGVGTPAFVAGRLGHCAILPARVHGFFKMEASVLRHVGVEPSVVFGPMRPQDLSSAQALVGILSRAGIGNTMVPDIDAELWEKLVLTSAFGGVGAATGLSAGDMRINPFAWSLLGAAMREVEMLAMKRGVRLQPNCAERTLAFVSSFPDEAESSMKRDIEAGRQSEYAHLTGHVIRMAGERALPVPAHDRIELMIRERGLLA